jgi:hypothetical protein
MDFRCSPGGKVKEIFREVWFVTGMGVEKAPRKKERMLLALASIRSSVQGSPDLASAIICFMLGIGVNKYKN